MRILTAKQIKAVETRAFESDSTEAELMLKAGTTLKKYAKYLAKVLQTVGLEYFAATVKMPAMAL